MADLPEWDPPLPADVRSRLIELVGLDRPDQNEPLHVELVNAIYRTRTKHHGDQITAVRFVFNWRQLEAGKRKGTLKAEYAKVIDFGTTRLLMEAAAEGRKLSRAEAEQRVRATDEAFKMHLDMLLAEHEEQSMRKFLDTLDSATETWRTGRADDRAGDTAHARGFGSHA